MVDPEIRPIVYVRGFGGTGSHIDDAVDDPFYGFNEGSTHVRAAAPPGDVQNPNLEATVQFYEFEGPLLRLMNDKGYTVPVHGDQRAWLRRAESGSVGANTIWIHRFYDQAASTFGADPVDYTPEGAAADLLTFIREIQDGVDGKEPKPVYLVAHSMGGLICRALLQKTIPESGLDDNEPLTYVDRLFTYATPHGGIEFRVGDGVIDRIHRLAGVFGADIFGHQRMREYMVPIKMQSSGGDFDPRDSIGYPPARIFSLVGTDSRDYAAAGGLSRRTVGASSDGLVMIDNAQVHGSPRSFVHRDRKSVV